MHSHEEDREGRLVFRRPTHPFPMARGRSEIEPNPDGTYVESVPGPVDVPVRTIGQWRLDADRLMLSADECGATRSWVVARAEADRLTVCAE